MPDTHREAERLLLTVDRIALRADALHLAGAAAIVAYDQKLAETALKTGLGSLCASVAAGRNSITP